MTLGIEKEQDSGYGHIRDIGSRTIASEENWPLIPKVTLTGGNFLLGKLPGCPLP